jgi:hypothetical protein
LTATRWKHWSPTNLYINMLCLSDLGCLQKIQSGCSYETWTLWNLGSQKLRHLFIVVSMLWPFQLISCFIACPSLCQRPYIQYMPLRGAPTIRERFSRGRVNIMLQCLHPLTFKAYKASSWLVQLSRRRCENWAFNPHSPYSRGVLLRGGYGLAGLRHLNYEQMGGMKGLCSCDARGDLATEGKGILRQSTVAKWRLFSAF